MVFMFFPGVYIFFRRKGKRGRYSAGIIDWTERDLKRMDVKNRKTLSMAGAFHTRGSSIMLYIKPRTFYPWISSSPKPFVPILAEK